VFIVFAPEPAPAHRPANSFERLSQRNRSDKAKREIEISYLISMVGATGLEPVTSCV
jgi:hypothetical protein